MKYLSPVLCVLLTLALVGAGLAKLAGAEMMVATYDAISNGRVEIVAGRGSFVEVYPLFGFAQEDYDALFVEKLDFAYEIAR